LAHLTTETTVEGAFFVWAYRDYGKTKTPSRAERHATTSAL